MINLLSVFVRISDHIVLFPDSVGIWKNEKRECDYWLLLINVTHLMRMFLTSA